MLIRAKSRPRFYSGLTRRGMARKSQPLCTAQSNFALPYTSTLTAQRSTHQGGREQSVNYLSQELHEGRMVGTTGFEPATSRTPSVRATRLRHVPTGSTAWGQKQRITRLREGSRQREVLHADRAGICDARAWQARDAPPPCWCGSPVCRFRRAARRNASVRRRS